MNRASNSLKAHFQGMRFRPAGSPHPVSAWRGWRRRNGRSWACPREAGSQSLPRPFPSAWL